MYIIGYVYILYIAFLIKRNYLIQLQIWVIKCKCMHTCIACGFTLSMIYLIAWMCIYIMFWISSLRKSCQILWIVFSIINYYYYWRSIPQLFIFKSKLRQGRLTLLCSSPLFTMYAMQLSILCIFSSRMFNCLLQQSI